MLTGLGRVWLASMVFLIFAPLINAYGIALGIPLLRNLTFPLAVTAIMVLYLGVPLSWGLGCAGLILERLARHRNKRKRKVKRKSRAEDRSLFMIAGLRATERRLGDPREIRLASADLEARQLRESELEWSGWPASPLSKS